MDASSVPLITTLFLVFLSAIVGGIIARRLRMPALIGYIASGVFFGNIFHTATSQEFLTQIADVGVALLLFTLGVEFSFHRLKNAMGSIVWGAAAQILLTILFFVLFFQWLGFGFLPALYVAVATSLSSTAIVVKVLSERGELDSIPGELSTAWLVIQDLAVVPIMIILPTLARVQSQGEVSVLAVLLAVSGSLLKAMFALALIWYLGRKGIPTLLALAARMESREIFLLSTIGVVFLAALAAFSFGLSAPIGAFIAGLLVSETSQNHAIFSEIRPLRDLFAVVFFVTLGMVLPIAGLTNIFGFLAVTSLLVILVKWFFVFGLTRYLGNHKKTAFIAAVALTQMSEFGFIIAREGLEHGALTADRYVFLVALTFVTMLLGTFTFSHVHELYYQFYKSFGKLFPKLVGEKHELSPKREELRFENHIVICGYGRVGKYIGRALDMAKVPYVVVDYNHTAVTELKEKGVPVVFGDPADKDVLDYAQVDLARALVVAIPDRHTQEMIIGNAQTLNRKIRIICRTHHEEDQKRLKSLGVSLVVQPEFEAALSVITRLLGELGVAQEEITGKVSRLKIEHGLG